MAKKIRVWDGTQWQDVAPSLPYTAIHSAQASMPLTGVDGQVWLDTDGTLAGQDFVPLSGGTMTGNLNVPSINSGPIVGRNKILNGDFSIWQRGTSVNLSVSTSTFLADRWTNYMDSNAGTVTYSRQAFAPGTAPVAGYEGAYFARLTTGGNLNLGGFGQTIEDVRTLAGQTVTISFWMKTSTPKTFTVLLRQNFGTGGSSLVDYFDTYTTSTTWQRFTKTFTLNSVSGKTIGSNSNLFVYLASYGSQTGNFDIDVWGVQLEAGNQATPFHTATPNQQTELAACQRYYARLFSNGSDQTTLSVGGMTYSTTNATVQFYLPVTMRTKPTAVDFANLSFLTLGGAQPGIVSLGINNGGTQICECIAVTNSSFTANQYVFVRGNTNGQAYVGFSAEL